MLTCVKELAPCQKAKAAQELQPQRAGENSCQPITTDYQTATINWAGRRVSDIARQVEMQHPLASFSEILSMIILRTPFKNLLAVSALQ